MKNQREIYQALLAGETLINKTLFTVKMNKEGMLESSKDESKGYTALFNTLFDNPSKWQIYKEPKWHKNIPDGGVLCWVRHHPNDHYWPYPVVVIGFNNSTNRPYTTYEKGNWYEAKPLTKQEIQVFMDNAPEDI